MMRVAFAGTPHLAARVLAAIHQAGYKIPWVLTQPDRPAGRGLRLAPSPVKCFAEQAGLLCMQPASLADEQSRKLLVAEPAPDLVVVLAYGLIIPKALLSWPRLGWVNLHASLLPRWRGAAPIVRALEAGDAETGVTLMQMDEGLDTGMILASRALAIAPDETQATLTQRLAELASEMILWALPQIETLQAHAQPQPAEGVTYAPKIKASEAMIDWRQPAAVIERKLRAFDPEPGAYTFHGATRIKVWRGSLEQTACSAHGALPGTILAIDPHKGLLVACGQGALWLTELQRAGSKRLKAQEFFRGYLLQVGDRLDRKE